MSQKVKTTENKKSITSIPINQKDTLDSTGQPPSGELADKNESASTGVENAGMVTTRKDYSDNLSIPKIIYDVAFITFLLPTFIYLHAYMYKLGKFNFYGIPTDYIDVGYNDILGLWTIPLIFIFVALLPFYTFFVPSSVLESFVKKSANKKSWIDSKTFNIVLQAFFVLLMSIVSFVILTELSAYLDFAVSIYRLFLSLVFSITLFWLQSLWNARESKRQQLTKVGSVIFSTLLLLISTTGISQELGKFQVERKTDYQTVCSAEKNWVRIGKSGDRIIAKEVNRTSNTFAEKTILISGNCEEVVIMENFSFTRIQPKQ